jgi:hypothetical protein
LSGDENLLLGRIDDEYGEQPGGLRRAGVGAYLVVVAGHLGPAFSRPVDILGVIVDLAAYLAFQHGRIDEGRGGVAMRGRRGARAIFDEDCTHALAGHVRQLRSKILETFDVGAAVSSAATFVASRVAPTSSRKPIFFTAIPFPERNLAATYLPI